MGAGFRVAVIRPGEDPYLTEVEGVRKPDGTYHFDGSIARIVGGPVSIIDHIHGNGAVVLADEGAVDKKGLKHTTMVCMGRNPMTGGPLDMTMDVWLTVCDMFAAD